MSLKSSDVEHLSDGDTVGNYLIEGRLAEGGYGVVYVARHRETLNRVALKLLKAEAVAQSHAAVARFRREARAANEIDHENFARTLDFGEHRGALYIAMEYVQGPSLESVVRGSGPLPLERTLAIVAQLAGALDAAHARGIIHRDIKPENIHLTQVGGNSDFVKILDLGIAKFVGDAASGDGRLTSSRGIIGSPYTMSPEQCQGSAIDHRSDVYALGVVVFFIATGRYPFVGEQMDVMYSHVYRRPPRVDEIAPHLPRQFADAVERALAKHRDDRHQSAGALASELVAGAGGAAPVELRRKVAIPKSASAKASGSPMSRWLLRAGVPVVFIGCFAGAAWLGRAHGGGERKPVVALATSRDMTVAPESSSADLAMVAAVMQVAAAPDLGAAQRAADGGSPASPTVKDTTSAAVPKPAAAPVSAHEPPHAAPGDSTRRRGRTDAASSGHSSTCLLRVDYPFKPDESWRVRVDGNLLDQALPPLSVQRPPRLSPGRHEIEFLTVSFRSIMKADSRCDHGRPIVIRVNR